MVEAMADSYALTSEGRLFYRRADGSVPKRTFHSVQYHLTVDDQRANQRTTLFVKVTTMAIKMPLDVA